MILTGDASGAALYTALTRAVLGYWPSDDHLHLSHFSRGVYVAPFVILGRNSCSYHAMEKTNIYFRKLLASTPPLKKRKD